MANIVSEYQVPSSNGLGVMMFEDWEEKGQGFNELINNDGVCRTAPATPGLLIIANFTLTTKLAS